MREMLLLKCGELVLKGLNRARFQNQLEQNLRRRLSLIGKFHIYSMQSTVYVEPLDGADMDDAHEAAKKVFGLAAVSKAAVCEKDLEAIRNTAADYLAPLFAAPLRFKVAARRSDKSFPYTSPEIAREVGGFLHSRFPQLSADMENPDVTVTVEVRDRHAFVHAGKEPGAGGMPVGSSGKAAFLLSGGIDSPVAAWLMARRGLALCAVHFFSYPYTSEEAKEKVISLAKILTGYTGRIELFIVPFTNIQEEIRRKSPEDMFTVVMRRFMMRIADKIAKAQGCGALITGESLGQVASQTMEALAVTDAAASLPVFRPLIGLDKEDIVKIARRIGTFETSILPYEDCCTVFTPKHPVTKPNLSRTLAAEAGLDIEGLVAEAAEKVERMGLTIER